MSPVCAVFKPPATAAPNNGLPVPNPTAVPAAVGNKFTKKSPIPSKNPASGKPV